MKNLFKNFISNIKNRILWFVDDIQSVNSQTQVQSQTKANTTSTSYSNHSDKGTQAVVTASKLIQNAYSKIEAGKYEEAIIDINNAIKLCPNDRDYHSLLESTKKRIKERDFKHAKEKQTQTRKEKLIQYIKNAKNYIANEDIKNATVALDIADRLDRNKEYRTEIRDLRCKIADVSSKIKADKLATEAYARLNSGDYQEAIKLFRRAKELGFYADAYNNAVTAFEEYKRKQQQEEYRLHEQYVRQAETHYKNAVKYYNVKNYKMALDEANEAVSFARKADLRSNKFIILKNKIQSDKKSTLNTSNNHASSGESNKTLSKNKKSINKFEGYGMLDDECDEYIPSNIAEIISKKTAGNTSYNKNNTSKEHIKDKNSGQKNLEKSELEKLIHIAEDFINMHTYKNAYEYIEKARKLINEDKDKEYIDKLELLSEKITLYTFEPDLKEMIQKNDYHSAIQQLKSFIKNKPDNKLFDKKLKYVETLYSNYKEFEELYNEALDLFKNKDYKTALSTINIALELAQDNGLSTDNFEKLKIKVESEDIYQDMLAIYKSKNINYELIIEKLRYVIVEKYADERYVSLLKKAVSEYNFIQEENYYNASAKDYEEENYTSALTNINKALKLNPNNEAYKELKNKINIEREQIKKDKKFDEYYLKSIEAYNNAEFSNATEFLNNAIKLKPENKDCKKLLEKILTEKIDIAACTKQALMTLDFINEELAENIIQARNNGEIWYDYQKFAEQFEIMPHLWADVEERIDFPLKQANKYGRRLDI